jgi:hypothetical protein
LYKLQETQQINSGMKRLSMSDNPSIEVMDTDAETLPTYDSVASPDYDALLQSYAKL